MFRFYEEDKFDLAKAKLTMTEPFYAILAQQCAIHRTTEVKTISIAEKGGTFYLLYNPDWIEGLKVIELAEAIKHVLTHLIFGHLNNEAFPESKRMGVAQDLAVNTNMNKNNLPKGFLTPKDFNLPEDLSTYEYFNLLENVIDEDEKDKDGNSGICSKSGDDHTQMTSQASEEQVQEQAKDMARQAMEESGGKKPANWGSGASHYLDEFIKPPTIPWRHILRRFPALSAKTKRIRTWKKPNRRYGEDFQGVKKECKINVLVAIDESGSIPDRDLVEFMVEIKGIHKTKPGKITIAKFTTRIEKTFEYKGINDDMKLRHSGGTSFQPIFELAEQLEPDCVIVFTDGENWDNPLKYKHWNKVLWVVTSGGSCANQQGMKVDLVADDQKPKTMYR